MKAEEKMQERNRGGRGEALSEGGRGELRFPKVMKTKEMTFIRERERENKIERERRGYKDGNLYFISRRV